MQRVIQNKRRTNPFAFRFGVEDLKKHSLHEKLKSMDFFKLDLESNHRVLQCVVEYAHCHSGKCAGCEKRFTERLLNGDGDFIPDLPMLKIYEHVGKMCFQCVFTHSMSSTPSDESFGDIILDQFEETGMMNML